MMFIHKKVRIVLGGSKERIEKPSRKSSNEAGRADRDVRFIFCVMSSAYVQIMFCEAISPDT